MNKMDNSIKGLVPSSTLLGRAFSGLGDIVSNLVSGVFRTLEYALGNLIAGAIQSVISGIKDMIGSVIEAGSQFQILEIRLQNLNFNDKMTELNDYGKAMTAATEMTKEQFKWIQKLAIQTPYDATDIANVFTLSRSYGFASDKAQGLTEDIT